MRQSQLSSAMVLGAALIAVGCGHHDTPEPFGLRAGMTEEQVLSVVGTSNVQAVEDDGVQGQYLKLDSVPNGDPAFDLYGCVFSPKYGLVEVYADDFGDHPDFDYPGEPKAPRFPGVHASYAALARWAREMDAYRSADAKWKGMEMAAEVAHDGVRIKSALIARYGAPTHGEWRLPGGTIISYDGGELVYYFPRYASFAAASAGSGNAFGGE